MKGTLMTQPTPSPALTTAIEKIKSFIESITGEAATDAELSDALNRYFVLKEICDHIIMIRNGEG